MQLQDVLDAPQLRLRVLVAGDGALARPVDGIFTTDLLDPRRYISRDQLVLTGLVWRPDARTARPSSPRSRTQVPALCSPARGCWASCRTTSSSPAASTTSR